jgi:cell division protein FtsA
MAEKLFTGLDIGSSTIRVVVTQVMTDSEGRDSLSVVGAVSVPTEGMSRGAVSSIEEVVSSISKALEKAERMTGYAIGSANISIAGQHIVVHESRGVVGVSRADNEIQESDLVRAIEAAQMVVMPANYEILHVLPKSYAVDGQKGIKDPVGMTGIKLELDAMIILTIASQMKNLTKAVHRTGLEIDDLIYAPLATSEAVLNRKQKELGVCLVDIGATSTGLIVYEEGDILHTAIIPIGSDHITHDIGLGLRASLDVAKNIKHEVGNASPSQVSSDTVYSLTDFGSQVEEEFNLKFLAEIINARVEELLEAVDVELRKVDRSGMLPAGVVLTGGGMHLPGVLEVAKKTLRLPAEIGIPNKVTSVIDEVNDPAYATAIGLAMWGFANHGNTKKMWHFDLKQFKKLLQGFVKIIKKIIP